MSCCWEVCRVLADMTSKPSLNLMVFNSGSAMEDQNMVILSTEKTWGQGISSPNLGEQWVELDRPRARRLFWSLFLWESCVGKLVCVYFKEFRWSRHGVALGLYTWGPWLIRSLRALYVPGIEGASGCNLFMRQRKRHMHITNKCVCV